MSLIANVLKGVDRKDIQALSDRWFEYLADNLDFPFEAKIEDSQSLDLKWGETVLVKRINNYDEFYGLLVAVRKDRKKYILPLNDLELVETASNNYKIIDAFLDWWSNDR